MSQLTVNRQGPEAFADNETSYVDTFTQQRDYKPPQAKHIDYRVYAVWAIACISALLVFWLIYSIWKFFYCWNINNFSMCRSLDRFEPLAFALIFFAPLVLVAANLILKYWTRTRYENALANRANLVLNRYGDQEPADLYDRLQVSELIALLEARYAAATGLERSIAPHKLYRGVNSLSLGKDTKDQTTIALAPSMPPDVLVPVAPDEWLAWLNDQPHVLFGAQTGKGKTTTAKAVLNMRIERGDLIFVIDPHSDDWYGLPVRGGGENWQDVAAAIEQIYAEYNERQTMRHQHLLVTQSAMEVAAHQALTVLVDEALLIAKHLNVSKKGQINYWELLTEVLGSGARKVNISVILLSQSTNVEDLDLSGPMRRNFTRVALDAPTIKTMIVQEENDKLYRQQLYEALIGMQYPATTVVDSRILLLDRTGLDTIAARHIDARSRLWIPPDCPKGRASRPIGPFQTDGRNVIEQLAALRRQGFTRDQAREEHGLTFTNEDWTVAGMIVTSEQKA